MTATAMTEPASRFLHAGHREGSPLVPSRTAGVKLAPACCVLGEWIVVLDGARLRRARARARLTQRTLAAESTVGLATIRRLEGQPRPHCHFRARARLAMALGTHPQALTADTTSHPELPGLDLPQASPLPADTGHRRRRSLPARIRSGWPAHSSARLWRHPPHRRRRPDLLRAGHEHHPSQRLSSPWRLLHGPRRMSPRRPRLA
jgi:hypothetical protein